MNSPKLHVRVEFAYTNCGHSRCRRAIEFSLWEQWSPYFVRERRLTFSGKAFPVRSREFSVIPSKIPCYVSQGILLEVFEFARRLTNLIADLGPKSKNSPVNFPVKAKKGKFGKRDWFVADCILSQRLRSLYRDFSVCENLRHSRGLGSSCGVSGGQFRNPQPRSICFWRESLLGIFQFRFSLAQNSSTNQRPVQPLPQMPM